MSRRGKAAIAAGMGALMLAGGPAQAEEARGKRAGDLVLGLGAVGVIPTNGSGRVDLLGGHPRASASGFPLADVTYFLTPQLSANLIASTTYHTLQVRNSALGTLNAGSVWALPPTLTLQFHPLPQARLSPYLGVGFNTSFFYGHSGPYSAPVTRVRVGTSFGVAANLGLDYEITPNWLANLDLKWIQMQPRLGINGGALGGRADLNPFVVSAAVRYRF
ncbi:MAG: OmpW family protein [Rhodovarius sp.]|nr:OmpW family protein [Rhodovarius sp.]